MDQQDKNLYLESFGRPTDGYFSSEVLYARIHKNELSTPKKSTSTAQLNEEEGGSPQNIRNKSTSEKQNQDEVKPQDNPDQHNLDTPEAPDVFGGMEL